MLTYLFLNYVKEEVCDTGDMAIACFVTALIVILDILLLLFQPIFYLTFRFLSKEDKDGNN